MPPTSTSMFNSICYELLAELADGIPDAAAAVRRRLGLAPRTLERKEVVTREHVHSTDPALVRACGVGAEEGRWEERAEKKERMRERGKARCRPCAIAGSWRA